MIKNLLELKSFWKKKKVFLTGHTGFKGSWSVIFLTILGAKVYGYSLRAKKNSFYNIAKLDKILTKSIIGDVRDYNKLKKNIKNTSPDFIVHMAAQPLVRFSYDKPKYTYDVNTTGTLNILNIVNEVKTIKNVLIVTTDKVYKNIKQDKYFEENDELGGYDPYSSSKACAELICQSYSNSFFLNKKISCVSVRAGNVIGGGDFALNRIIPDYFRAYKTKKKLYLRYPNAIRPWQHVIEPLYGYLLLMMIMYKQKKTINTAFNFGPAKKNNIKVKKIISILNTSLGKPIKIIEAFNNKDNYKESDILKLSSKKAYKLLNWKPKYNIMDTMRLITEWYIVYFRNRKEILNISKKQILNYINLF